MSPGTDGGESFGDPIQDPVLVADYDESWPEHFQELRERLKEALGSGALRIDHVGSTAVPELAAKPVIDVQVSVSGLEDEGSYRPALKGLGYTLRFRSPERRFFRAPAEPRAVHVHVVGVGSREERVRLLFAAYLRAHPERRDAYAALKRDLARRHRNNREDYLGGKAAFIEETLALAEQEHGRDWIR